MFWQSTRTGEPLKVAQMLREAFAAYLRIYLNNFAEVVGSIESQEPARSRRIKNNCFCADNLMIDAEAIASPPASPLAGNRPAYRGPSRCQCWGRWTEKSEPVTKVMSESESTAVPEHREKLGKDSKVLCQG